MGGNDTGKGKKRKEGVTPVIKDITPDEKGRGKSCGQFGGLTEKEEVKELILVDLQENLRIRGRQTPEDKENLRLKKKHKKINRS